MSDPHDPGSGQEEDRQHRVTVPAELAGERLDRCLAALCPQWTRSRVRRLIDEQRVLVNGKAARPALRVQPGDELLVHEPRPRPFQVPPEEIPLQVLFEDEDLLVINKPAGLVIHPAAGNPSGTLVNALLHHCTRLSGIGGVERPGIVHRLDKETSGCLVVAKTEHAHRGLALAFRRRQVEKLYRAVCYGIPQPADGLVDAPIGRHRQERQQMAVTASGRSARTLYQVVERFAGTALVICRPVTGRTHQIRVHMAHLGHALVGDPLYTGRQWRNLPDPVAAAACRLFPRQALHAWRLGFVHPVGKQQLVFEAPLPDDMVSLLETLRQSPDGR